MYDKRRNRNVWRLKNYGTHITQNTAVPDFFASDKALTSALSTGQITIYVGSANAKIAIYSKKNHYPDYVTQVSIAWIEAGMSLKKIPAEKIIAGARYWNYSNLRPSPAFVTIRRSAHI